MENRFRQRPKVPNQENAKLLPAADAVYIEDISTQNLLSAQISSQEIPKIEYEFSPETVLYLNSLQKELSRLDQWILAIRPLFREIRTLQDSGPETNFQILKNELWNNYKNVVLPELIKLRQNRIYPPGVEIITIHQLLNEKYNPANQRKSNLLSRVKASTNNEKPTKESAPQQPIDHHTLNLLFQNIGKNLQDSLQTFHLAKNFHSTNETNAFRIDVWMEKIRTAQITLQDLLTQIPH